VNPEKVVFGFFILLALTLNVGFVYGEIDNPDHHHVWEFAAVVLVNGVATILKLGDRTQMGAVLLATSLVAMLQLLGGALVWTIAAHGTDAGVTAGALSSVVSLAAGALVANIVSVVLLIIETVLLRR
jgi:Ca2+/H+ antiporter, TMEM165/GDT1 family